VLTVTSEAVRSAIEKAGIVPAIRVHSAEDALFAAETVYAGGIQIVELTMTVPGATGVITRLRNSHPDLLVGAGTVLDADEAAACLDAGAAFLTSPGFEPSVVQFAGKWGIAVIPGALTPTEVMMAWKAGADLVKIFPCASVGGPSYIRALKAPFPEVPMIASGGVNPQTAVDYIRAGATALGIRDQLLPSDAVTSRDTRRILELTRRFRAIVDRERAARPAH
jgi:2-dehydro-3-deoxyphosphogluconate aldolase/(4S)-4-hydroxy-2-oxoglutarate aldolase